MKAQRNDETRPLPRTRRPFPPSPVAAVLTAICLVLAAGCISDGTPRLDGPVLRIGVSPDYPPVVFERDGTLLGIEPDLARLAGSALRRPIEFVRIPFSDLLDALEAGEIDVVMSGMSITPDRLRRVRFTRAYMEIGQLALIRTRDIARLGRRGSIRRAGIRVGFERDTTGERFVAEELPVAESFAFDSVDEGIRSLRAGRIDFFVHDAPTIWTIAGSLEQRDLHGLYRPLTKEALAWAVRREDEPLRAALDASIAQWQEEGAIDPIVQRWIPVRVTQR